MDNKICMPQFYPVTAHTDFVTKGSTFVAIAGNKGNGIDYVEVALQKGASEIVIEQGSEKSGAVQALVLKYSARLTVVDNCRKALAVMSAAAFGNPANKLKIIGVTGTKGKTSTSYMIYHMLKSLGKKVALSTTVEKMIQDQLIAIPLTTPLPDQLHVFFDLCLKHGVEYVVLEVSAQALSLHRVAGIAFEAGVFTNFSMEHLEFYDSMQDYFKAKSLLVNQIKKPCNMFINIDDQYGELLLKNNPECSSFSLQEKNVDVYGWSHLNSDKINLHVKVAGKTFNFESMLLGKFNGYNMLAALSVVYSLGLDLSLLESSLMYLKMIPGRMEQYRLKNNAQCFIDYAHNPSSFEAVLSTLRNMTNHLIVVFGAGGCRDKHKRPIMGAVAQKYCDAIILTSDNPRDEDPLDIMHDIEQGLNIDKIALYKILNRIEAITFSYSLSKPGTIIAVLGKGRDEYQIVGDLTFPFKERSIIKQFVKE